MSNDKLILATLVVLGLFIVVLVVLSDMREYRTLTWASDNGYIQVRDPGYSGYRWVKETP